MNKSDFIIQYCLSAVQGCVGMKGALKPKEVVKDAEDTWEELELRGYATTSKATRKKSTDEAD